jgi:hypothetical protein
MMTASTPSLKASSRFFSNSRSSVFREAPSVRQMFPAADALDLSQAHNRRVPARWAMQSAPDPADPTPPGESPHESVERIVYASQSRITGSVYAEMERIRVAALRHNTPLRVHTALLYQSGWFVQWKEGPGGAMESLMTRVARDKRHHSLRVIHSSHGPRLLDGPWSMAIVQRVEKNDDMTLRVLQLRERIQAGAQYAPPSIWRQLSTPMQLPTAVSRAEPDVFQRVIVCAAFGSASMELVQWLAQRMDASIVHRRFAGPHERDISTDLIDVEHDGEALRVVAMARAGLALPLTRAFMADFSHVVMLLCGNPERDLALLKSVVSAIAALPSPPVLLGVAAAAAAHAQPGAIARGLGLRYFACCADSADSAAAWEAMRPLLAEWRQAANSDPLAAAPRARTMRR